MYPPFENSTTRIAIMYMEKFRPFITKQYGYDPDEIGGFITGMAIRVVEFSSGGYKIRKIFA